MLDGQSPLSLQCELKTNYRWSSIRDIGEVTVLFRG